MGPYSNLPYGVAVATEVDKPEARKQPNEPYLRILMDRCGSLGGFALWILAASSTRLHALDEDLRRFRPHDARVGELAGAELLAQLAAGDRDLLETLRA